MPFHHSSSTAIALVWHSTPQQQTILLHQLWVCVLCGIILFPHLNIIKANRNTQEQNTKKHKHHKLYHNHCYFVVKKYSFYGGKNYLFIWLLMPVGIQMCLPEHPAVRLPWPWLEYWAAAPDHHKVDQSWHDSVTLPHGSVSMEWPCRGLTSRHNRKIHI